MHSASRLNCADSAAFLFAALNELLRAVAGRVILLRPLTGCFDSSRDDIDLLLSELQRDQLLRAAFAEAIRGRIHCRILQISPAKTQLVLWAVNCSQKLAIDLWTSFDQLPRCRHKCIPADRLLSALTDFVPALRRSAPSDQTLGERSGTVLRCSSKEISTPDNAPGRVCTNTGIPALRQLPPDLDLCLLIQHLAKKRKRLTTSAVQERIALAAERLRSWSPEPSLPPQLHTSLAALRVIADQLPRAIIITPKSIVLSEDYLLRRLACVPGNRGLQVLTRRRRPGLMTGLRKTVMQHRPAVAVIGSDGAGKSSVVAELGRRQANVTPLVAKKLYRRSLAYQLTSGLMKRFCRTDRSVFDDLTARLITLRAIAGLWVRMCSPLNPWSQARPFVAREHRSVAHHGGIDSMGSHLRVTILDRSVASFLITDRKSDTPNLVQGSTWIEAIIPPVASILLTLQHSELTRRRNEMSVPGHDAYQRMLFEQALRQKPIDLTLLADLPSAAAAATAIGEILRSDTGSVDASGGNPRREKVAA